jgi:hypothetical protein
MINLKSLLILGSFMSLIFLGGCNVRFTSPLQGEYNPYAPVVRPIAQPIPRHHPAWRRDSGRAGPHVLSPTRMHWPQNRPRSVRERGHSH